MHGLFCPILLYVCPMFITGSRHRYVETWLRELGGELPSSWVGVLRVSWFSGLSSVFSSQTLLIAHAPYSRARRQGLYPEAACVSTGSTRRARPVRSSSVLPVVPLLQSRGYGRARGEGRGRAPRGPTSQGWGPKTSWAQVREEAELRNLCKTLLAPFL